jgi:hypothetical protein
MKPPAAPVKDIPTFEADHTTQAVVRSAIDPALEQYGRRIWGGEMHRLAPVKRLQHSRSGPLVRL